MGTLIFGLALVDSQRWLRLASTIAYVRLGASLLSWGRLYRRLAISSMGPGLPKSTPPPPPCNLQYTHCNKLTLHIMEYTHYTHCTQYTHYTTCTVYTLHTTHPAHNSIHHQQPQTSNWRPSDQLLSYTQRTADGTVGHSRHDSGVLLNIEFEKYID